MSNNPTEHTKPFYDLMGGPEECDYCGQSDPEVKYTLLTFSPNEPCALACEDCMEEQPWK